MISIITPSFNPGELIFETYKSLENQTYKNFEWIIIDDNSNEINAKYYQDIKRKASFDVEILRNEINLKQAKCKNIGIEKALGEYIKFLDADDLLDKDHLKNQIETFQKQKSKNNIAVFSPTINFYGNSFNSAKKILNSKFKEVNESNIQQLKTFLVFPFFHHCGCLFKTEEIRQMGGFDSSLITDEDGDFIIQLMIKGTTFILDERSNYLYRHHNLNSRVSTNDSSDKWNARKKVCVKIENNSTDLDFDINEALAQRLDILGQQSYNSSKEISQDFFDYAKLIYPKYRKPGKTIANIIRTILGIEYYLLIKEKIQNGK